MSLRIFNSEINSTQFYPFRTPDTSATIETINNELVEIEKQLDSPECEAELQELDTGGFIFQTNQRPGLNIMLKAPKHRWLKKFGVFLMPVEFGNLAYMVKIEYLDSAVGYFNTKEERLNKVKDKLSTIDKYMQYQLIQTIGDYVFVELIEKFDPNFDKRLKSFGKFMRAE